MTPQYNSTFLFPIPNNNLILVRNFDLNFSSKTLVGVPLFQKIKNKFFFPRTHWMWGTWHFIILSCLLASALWCNNKKLNLFYDFFSSVFDLFSKDLFNSFSLSTLTCFVFWLNETYRNQTHRHHTHTNTHTHSHTHTHTHTQTYTHRHTHTLISENTWLEEVW